MAIKRKHDSTPPNTSSAGGSSQAKKQATQPLNPRQKVEQEDLEVEVELEEEGEEEGEEEEEEEEEDDDDEEEEEGDSLEMEPKPESKNKSNIPPKGKDASITYDHFKISTIQEDCADADEPLPKILELFSKDQLTALLLDAAASHPDVADRLRRMADSDPTHRKIFIHGLGWDTTSETLSNAFRQYGEIEDCKVVVNKASGRSKGYGFILFKTRRGSCNALKEPQKRIGNRMTACQLAAIGPGPSPAPSSSSQGPPPHPVSEHAQRKIYVSNVGTDLDPRKLYDYFAKFGEIEEGPLGLDRFTGKPKGFCLFIYKTVESARKALEEPHKNFEGHILHCQKAIEGPKHGKQQQLQNPQLLRNDNVVGFPGGVGVGQLVGGQPAVGGMGFAQGAAAAAAAPALNPALGQAITALLATQGAGFGGLTNLLGSLGAAAAVNQVFPAAGQSLQGAYGNQVSVSPGVIGGYGTQSGFPNQQMAPGASGRGQNSAQFGGAVPYIGH